MTTGQTRLAMNKLITWINRKEVDCATQEKFVWMFQVWGSIRIYCNAINPQCSLKCVWAAVKKGPWGKREGPGQCQRSPFSRDIRMHTVSQLSMGESQLGPRMDPNWFLWGRGTQKLSNSLRVCDNEIAIQRWEVGEEGEREGEGGMESSISANEVTAAHRAINPLVQQHRATAEKDAWIV